MNEFYQKLIGVKWTLKGQTIQTDGLDPVSYVAGTQWWRVSHTAIGLTRMQRLEMLCAAYNMPLNNKSIEIRQELMKLI